MTLHMTLVAVPSDDDARNPRFPGRQRRDLPLASLPERVHARLAETGAVVHPPEIALDASFRAEIVATLAEVDHGRWAGRAMVEVAEAEPDAFVLWRTDTAFAPPGGEALLAARARAGRWLGSLAGRSGHMAVLAPMIMARVLLTAALDAPLPLIWRFDVTPWSMAELTRHRNRWALRLG